MDSAPKIPDTSGMNLYQKIAAVMTDIQYLSKDDSIEFKSTRYKALSEEKTTKTVRDSLIKYGLVIIPVDQEITKTGNLTTVNTKYKIVNIDNPEDYAILASSGEGADSQDKGAGKAMTYAYKYMLLRTFAIPTGEDPDKTSAAELDEKERAAKELAEREEKERLEKERKENIDILKSELDRTGIEESNMFKNLKIKGWDDVTPPIFKTAMARFKKTPDKAVSEAEGEAAALDEANSAAQEALMGSKGDVG